MRPRGLGQEHIAIAVLGLTFGVVFFDRNALNLLIPFIIRDIPLSNTQIGLLASGLSLTWAASGLIVGRMSDRLSMRKPLLLIAVAIFSVAGFTSGLANSFAGLFAARLLMGLAEGPVLPISQCLVTQVSPPERRGRNMGLMQTVPSSLIAGFGAPLIIVAVANAYGWRSTFFMTVLPGVIAATLIALAVHDRPSSNPVIASMDRSDGIRAVLAARNVWVCMAVSAMMVGWLIVGWAFLPISLVSQDGIDTDRMSFLIGLSGPSSALAGWLLPTLSDRFGRRPILVVGCLIGIAVPLAILFGSRSLALMSLLTATGWLAGGTFSIFMATIPSESTNGRSIATAIALIVGAGELFGGTLAPTIVGYLADRFGLVAAPVAQMVLAVLAASCALLLVETAPSQFGVSSRDPVLV